MKRWPGSAVVGLGLVVLGAAAAGCRSQASEPARAAREAPPGAVTARLEAPPPDKTPDVIFVPTPQTRVNAMLEMAKLQRGEKLYDLGCGDGRIAVAAAKKYGARAVCVDVDPQRIAEAKENVRRAGVEDLVEVRHADLFETDFSDADVVTLYLLPSLNEKLRPKLWRELKPGARVVSHAFDMGSWQPDQRREVDGGTLYLWHIREGMNGATPGSAP